MDSKQLEISLGTDASGNLEFAKKSREAAKEYTWLYHCTDTTAAESIIKKRELWLSNLRAVNDKDEANRIDLKNYKDKFYIGSFTYDPEIPREHWAEYGTLRNGVLIGFKQDWFKCEPQFVMPNGTRIDDPAISPTSMFKSLKDPLLNHMRNPLIKYSVEGFGFYKVVYDDDLMVRLQASGWLNGNKADEINAVIPEVAGIVKKKKGLCSRAGSSSYEKNWEEEKEVRLKIRLEKYCTEEAPSKLRIPLTDAAFDELVLEFSPEFPEDDKSEFLKKVHNLLPESTIVNSKGQKYSIGL